MAPPIARPATPLLGLLLLALASCGTSPIDGSFAAVVVYGRVTGPGTAPVSGVVVDLDVFLPACDTRIGPALVDTTDAAGQYRLQPGEWGSGFTVCVRVVATPAPSSGLAPDSTTRSPVQMRSVLDSVRVDLPLAPTP